MENKNWSKNSWRTFEVAQKVAWPNQEHCENILKEISKLPALVFAGETRILKAKLAAASKGEAFVLQCGDCAEEFAHCNGPRIHSLIKIIFQMSTILAYSGERQVVNIGRMAGQYAKPRSSDLEEHNGVTLPSYRGDMVNGSIFSLNERTPNPQRMLEGYFRSVATLNLTRAFIMGGYASLENMDDWHREFETIIPTNEKYETLARELSKATRFINTVGMKNSLSPFHQMPLFVSHEALILEYEEALTRIDTTTGDWFDTSAHFLWIGDRTRGASGAHAEFLRGIGNPLGIKVSADYDLDDLIHLIDKLNPSNEPGKISLITRMGFDKIKKKLPHLIEKISAEKKSVVWICDPMHGNTYKTVSGHKTRKIENILEEIRAFFTIHNSLGTQAGGIHLELTNDLVTECVGGRQKLSDLDLNANYQTSCDPRLNATQSIEIAFEIAEMLRKT